MVCSGQIKMIVCGGKHRSVYVTEQMAQWLKDLGYAAHIDHRDMPTD